SPYHVTHPGVVELFEELRNPTPGPSPTGRGDVERSVEDSSVKTAVYATSPLPVGEGPGVGSRRHYHLTNYLLEAVEKFLALEIWEQRPHERHRATLEHLRRLRLDHAGDGMIRYARKRLNADPQRGSDYHRNDYLLHLEAYYRLQQEGRAKSANPQELADAQDVAFICEKLRTGCLLLSHQAVTKREYDKGLLDHVLQFLEGHRYLQIPAVAAYYHGYFAQLGGQADDHFNALKNILQEHAGQFSIAEIHDLYLMAINYSIRRINQADERFFREIFELYQSGLRQGALLEDGTLSRWTYNNIAVTALRLREFGWVYKFLHDFAPFLPENHREGAFNFNIARYCYDTGDYRQAMQHLLRMEYDDVLQNLAAKTLLSKIYYELDETDALENQLDSIQIYLRRKKVLGYHKDNYTAFVRFMRKMLGLNHNSIAEKENLRREIGQAPTLTEREWFLKRLATYD
ncbi:MAG TPA: hypothetical protein PK228_00495, partial [Saprospiraceae bacterium]|nr:hypothetical protein [Saprospiraceae bacterium]